GALDLADNLHAQLAQDRFGEIPVFFFLRLRYVIEGEQNRRPLVPPECHRRCRFGCCVCHFVSVYFLPRYRARRRSFFSAARARALSRMPRSCIASNGTSTRSRRPFSRS